MNKENIAVGLKGGVLDCITRKDVIEAASLIGNLNKSCK